MGEQIGTRIKQLRLKAGITQAQMAKDLMLSPSTIGMYEQNRREPDLVSLVKLARYFQVSADYLLGLTDGSLISHFSSKNAFVLSEQEQELLVQYRKNEAFHSAADLFLMLDPICEGREMEEEKEEQEEQIHVFEAAFSEDRHPPQFSHLTKTKWEEIVTAPETDDPLL